MKNLLPIEVEPLNEQRWTKIERSLMARVELEKQETDDFPELRRRSAGRVWLAAAALLTVLVLVVAVRWSPEQAALDPSRIVTGESASHLALPGLALDVDPQSAVVVSPETREGLLLVLDRGSIVCEVAPRSTDTPLIVQAGAARVRVIGTRFSVTRIGEVARVKVYEGVVEVTSGGETRRVSAGERWSSDDVRARSDESDGSSEAAGDAIPVSELPSVDEVEVSKTEPSPRLRRSSSAADTRRRSGTAESTRSPSDSDSASGDEAEARPSPQAVYEEATAIERSNPTKAAQLYRSLESGSDSWAQIALYARGRLAASRGNASEARRLLGRYLQRFPRGSNAEDARAVLRRLK